MAGSDTFRLGDLFPFSLLFAPASIYPPSAERLQESPGTASLEALGGPLPWGCDRAEPAPEGQG
jgi:hypothetical protein